MILLLVFAVQLGSGQAPPAIPELALTTYPPAARETLSRLHQIAVQRPMDPGAVGTLGRWLHAWELWESAHQAYARAQALAPRSFEWTYLDALVLQRLARHAESAARLQQAIQSKPDYLPARMKLAEALLEAGDLEESRKLFEVLVKEPAAEPAAHVGLGRIAALQSRHEVAVRHFERAVQLFPELGAAHYGLARSYRAIGRREEAVRALELHSRYGPRWPGMGDPVLESVSSLRQDPRARVQRGVSYAQTGDLDKAIAEHETALADDPSLTQAHVNLISLYGRTGNWPDAEKHYHAAVKAGVNNAEAHYDYGVILGLQEKWDPAADAYRRALSVNPLHVESRNNLGQVLERRREFEAAAAEYRQAAATKPTFRLARFNLGRMLLVLGRNDQAIVEFEKLQQPEDAETPRYAFALATAYVRAGRKDEGMKWALHARHLAVTHGQNDLAAAIGRELEKLK